MKAKTDKRSGSTFIFWLASLMFFLSGGTGLAYQVIWFKRFGHVWGSSSLAFAAVGASFLCGLGFGAYLLGRIADRIERPLAWYGACELAIGLAAIVIPHVIQWLINATSEFYAHLPADPLARYLLQFGITLLVIGPPCVLMGGTLPLLIREMTAREGSLDQATGWLYAVNTFGAAAGCYLTGFVLLPHVGLLEANYLAAAINLSIGGVSILVSSRGPARRKEARTALTVAEPAPRSLRLIGLYVAVTLSGLAALMLEITWSRQLALVLGGSTYSYSSTLFVVLIGIASGSLLFHLVLRPYALNPWLPIITIGALVFACMVSHTLLPQIAWLVGYVRDSRATFTGNALVCAAAGAAVELIPALAMGILFPLFVDLTHAHASRVGRTVGDIYAWNTFGSIVGASLTGILLFPHIGTAGAMALSGVLYIITLVLVLPLDNPAESKRAVVCTLVGALFVAATLVPQRPIDTNCGQYMYGYPANGYDDVEELYFAEGASTNVLVSRHSDSVVSLRVNGKTDASTNPADMAMQLGAAYFPRFLRPDASDILVIGFGSGTTSGTSLLFPDAHVTCCEIEPKIFGAAPLFDMINHRPYEHTREFLTRRNEELPESERLSAEEIDEKADFTIHFGDGRTLLQQDDKQYDLIISEPSNPWIAGVSNLFTQEFFQTAKAHLKPGGVLAQWIQTYNLSFDDYVMIIRTMQSVFPQHYGLLVLSGSDTILLASDEPLVPDAAAVERMQKYIDDSPEITADLQKWYNTTDLKLLLLSRFTVGPDRLAMWARERADEPLNTDLNMRLEFAAPLALFKQKKDETRAQDQIGTTVDAEWVKRLAERIGVSPDSKEYVQAKVVAQVIRSNPFNALPDARELSRFDPLPPGGDALITWAYTESAQRFALAKRSKDRIAVLENWVKTQPNNGNACLALIDAYFDEKRNTDAFRNLKALSQRDTESADLQAEIANRFCKLQRSLDAYPLSQKALALNPALASKVQNALWVNNYAWLLATHPDPAMRNGIDAVRWAKAMCEAIDFREWTAIDTLAAAYAEIGDFDKALKLVEQIRQIAEKDNIAQAAAIVDSRKKLFEAHKPYREDPLTHRPVEEPSTEASGTATTEPAAEPATEQKPAADAVPVPEKK